ncbi:hypothetical protein C8F04DRAFT_1239570 [Mycena alexandri]|uniref:Uncharacterized protein n=1 Tax=Mycena alexandri TaxID=1745969 RepID=A0AAD6SC00_9AGAR|nr:hypothetical protein C8F04DRAFT_1239570 [Mycena alexandri]
MSHQDSKFHTVNQIIYGGTGGGGGKGGVEGGNGGTGEGPKMYYDVKAEQFTVVNNHGIQQMDSVERKQIIEWLSPSHTAKKEISARLNWFPKVLD